MLEHKPNRLEDELCFSIYTAQRFYNRFYTDALKKYKLTHAQYITLLILWETKEPMIIRDLGERLNLDTGTLTPLLKRMEKDGWVVRQKTKADGRKVYIKLTDKAFESEDGIKAQVTSCFKNMDMSQEEYQQAVHFIQGIAQKLAENNELLANSLKF